MPPQKTYTLTDLQNWETTGAGLSPPARLAVFGDPVDHSLSPQLHNPALEESGLGMQYIRIQVSPEDVPTALEKIAELGFVGTNVTVPHKFTMLETVDHVDGLAQKLGAVNTVIFRDGETIGFNTDGPGFVRAIREEFTVDLRDLRVLVLGAGGGAGRAVAVQCAVESCERLVLVNRTLEKAESLAAELSPYFTGDHLLGPADRLSVVPWTTDGLRTVFEGVDLIINATSLGMRPADSELVSSSLFQPHHMVYDMIYSPPKTRLLSAAEAAGARVANGLSMLVHQGAIAFEHWFSRPAPVSTMRDGIARAIQV